MVWTPLILDSFQFDEAHLETPESFGDTGGHQSIEQHDFPGGTRTQKSYGYFPAMLKWKARFHGSATASSPSRIGNFLGSAGAALASPAERAAAVGRIVAAGKEVKLQYGDHSWLGRAAKFTPTIRHNWLYEYELEFWPRLDFSNPGAALPPVTDLGTVLSLHLLALQSLVKYGLNPDFIGQTIAGEIGGPVGFLVSQVTSAVAAVGGNINNLTDGTQQNLQALSQSTMTTLAPHQASSNPLLSSPASDAAARVQAISTIMTAAQPTQAVVATVNPNLPVLAAVYYGDPSKWRTIAKANPQVNSNPQPIGSFNLTIPQAAA